MGYERIEDDVYVFSSELYAQVTAGLVFTTAGAILVDTLPFPRETQAIVQFERRRGGAGIRYVINTHHHSDHVYGNYLFPHARVIGHERGRAALLRDGQESLEQVKADTPLLANVQLRLPDITLDSGGAIHLGGKSLEIVPLPGHSGDVLGVLLVEEKILFASDAMMPVPFIVYGDIDDSKASLQAISQMNLENLVQGHGEVLLRGEIPDALAASIAYLDTIRARVREGIEMGLSEREIASLDIEECGLSRVPLSGLVQNLHRANLIHLRKGILSGAIPAMPRGDSRISGDGEGADEQPD